MNMQNNMINSESKLNKRIRVNYSDGEKFKMDHQRSIVRSEFIILNHDKKSQIFENQEKISFEIITKFKDRKICNVMTIAEPQGGKTGTMCAVINNYMMDDNDPISPDNIYIITGLSSIEWKEQTQERIPPSIRQRVFHRSELPVKFASEIASEIAEKKNILIIMDEVHIAAGKRQTVKKAFENAGLLDKQVLYQKDVKILEFSATPGGTLYDLQKWKDVGAKICASPGDGYTSSYDLLQQNRVKQYKDLCGYNRKTGEINKDVFKYIKEIKNNILALKIQNKVQLYHLIRTKNAFEQDITINNFKKVFNEDGYQFLNYDGKSDITDINEILTKKPLKPTFIFIKEMLRCAKTMTKKYLGIGYDRYAVKPDDSTVIQSLAGRFSGYDDNGFSICYTNIRSINRYKALWDCNFDREDLPWDSSATKFKNGILIISPTFNSIKHYTGFETDDSDNNSVEENRFERGFFLGTLEEVHTETLKIASNCRKLSKPKDKDKDDYGCYKISGPGCQAGMKRVYSSKELADHAYKGSLGSHLDTAIKNLEIGKYSKRRYICYEDVKDPSTMRYCLISVKRLI